MTELKHKNIAVLYSGGLDSRLVVRILQEQDNRVEAVFFKLPFASDKPLNDNFLENFQVPLEILDCTQGVMLTEYLEILKHPHFGRGAGYNPCIDCKLFMFKYVHNYAVQHNIDGIATGEVPGQRPMSQTGNAQRIFDKELDFEVIRPLKEMGLKGRSRKIQFELAKKYHINQYPTPAGGCLLCQKELARRYATLLERDLVNEKTLPLVNIGRHYYFSEDQAWIVVGRNEQENKVIEQYAHQISSSRGTPAVYYHSIANTHYQSKTIARELQAAYQSKDYQKIAGFKPHKI